VGEGAAVRVRPPEVTAEVAQLGQQQRRARVGAGDADEDLDGLVGELAEDAVSFGVS